MRVEIRGTETVNKGAQLMRIAIVSALADEFELSCAPGRDDYPSRAHLGLNQTLTHGRYPRAATVVGNRVPRPLRRRFGLSAAEDIGGVVDASGFAYSDSFDAQLAEREALMGEWWQGRGSNRILLPQAFGPFLKQRMREAAIRVVRSSVLAYARDSVSEMHLQSLGTGTVVKRGYDFTISLPCRIPSGLPREFLALVPNGKLVERGVFSRERYIEYLRDWAQQGEALGLTTLVIVHEATDRSLATEVCEGRRPYFEHDDPLVLRGTLGLARAVVSSRYHGAVGGLSQGVPTVAPGWSHKYAELMKDFDVPHWHPGADSSASIPLSRLLSDVSGQAALNARLPFLRDHVKKMWHEIVEALVSRV